MLESSRIRQPAAGTPLQGLRQKLCEGGFQHAAFRYHDCKPGCFPGGSAAAQESRSEIGLQGTGFFTTDTTGQGTTQPSTNTGGFLIGYRYSFNRWLAAEAVYGYDRNTQQYFAPTGFSRVEANIHQGTGGFVFRLPTPARLRISPYLLTERGALVFVLLIIASAASQVRSTRQPVCLRTAAATIFRCSGMSLCVLDIVASCTAPRTSGCQRSTPIRSLTPRSRQLESCSGSDRCCDVLVALTLYCDFGGPYRERPRLSTTGQALGIRSSA